jgi:hypothetical protein
MIPLHLHTTTIHVSADQAERLVASAYAEWLPETPALRVTRHVRRDDEVRAALAAGALAVAA